jgi:hypothetical protein
LFFPPKTYIFDDEEIHFFRRFLKNHMKKGYIILVALFLVMLPLNALHAEQVVRMANVDNFVMYKFLNKGVYSKDFEDVLSKGIVEGSVMGAGWDNRKQIDRISLADKVIKVPEAGRPVPGKTDVGNRIVNINYPYKNSGWTDIYLSGLDSSGEILLEIEGGNKEPVQQWVGNIGIRRPDGIIENIPVSVIGALDKKKASALILSDDYYYYRKDKGDLKELLDKELTWRDGFQILVIRKMLQTVPGEDERFRVLVNPGGFNNYNDTVLIRISPEKGKFSASNPPTIIIGWKTVEELDEGGGGGDED